MSTCTSAICSGLRSSDWFSEAETTGTSRCEADCLLKQMRCGTLLLAHGTNSARRRQGPLLSKCLLNPDSEILGQFQEIFLSRALKHDPISPVRSKESASLSTHAQLMLRSLMNSLSRPLIPE